MEKRHLFISELEVRPSSSALFVDAGESREMMTTMAVGEEGGGTMTTMAVGEECGLQYE